jgi:RNA polymerase sigma-70 factor (ECF subfamily)
MSVEETADLFGCGQRPSKRGCIAPVSFLRAELDRQLGPALTSSFPFGGRRCERMTEIVVQRICVVLAAGNLRRPPASNHC